MFFLDFNHSLKNLANVEKTLLVRLGLKEFQVPWTYMLHNYLSKMTIVHQVTKDFKQSLTYQIQTLIRLIERVCFHPMKVKHYPSGLG